MQILKNLHAFVWTSMTTNNCNTYLIDGPTRILIDPGHKHLFGHVEKGLENLGLSLEDIHLVICTHAHPDHMEAAMLFSELPALFALHEKEWQWINQMHQLAGNGYHEVLSALTPDILLTEGNLHVQRSTFRVLLTPGHTPGGISLYWPSERVLFTGDSVFKMGIGRTDLPGGNASDLMKSISALAELDVQWMLPGHGHLISGQDEVKYNFDHISPSR